MILNIANVNKIIKYAGVRTYYLVKRGQGSSVGIATDYRLDGPRIESRWGRDFPPVQTGPGATQPPVKWVPGLFRG